MAEEPKSELEEGYRKAAAFSERIYAGSGRRYADYLREHDAELRAKGIDPTPWPRCLQGNDGD